MQISRTRWIMCLLSITRGADPGIPNPWPSL